MWQVIHWLRPIRRKCILSDGNPNVLIVFISIIRLPSSLVMDDSSPHHFICQLDRGWHRQFSCFVDWAISCDRQLQALCDPVIALTWSNCARLDMSQLQVDVQTDGSVKRTFESDRGIWKDPMQGGTWRDLRAVPGICVLCYLSIYQCNNKTSVQIKT